MHKVSVNMNPLRVFSQGFASMILRARNINHLAPVISYQSSAIQLSHFNKMLNEKCQM